MKKTISILSLVLVLAMPAAASESRFVMCDSTRALLSGVKMEFLRINSVPLFSSYDGLIRYSFPENVAEAEVMFTGAQYDTLRTTIRPNECPQWIVLRRRAGTDNRVYYTLGASVKTRAMTSKAIPEAEEMEVLSVVEDAVAREDAYAASYSKPKAAAPMPASNNLQAGKLTAGEVNDFAKWHLWKTILTQSHAQYVDIWKMNVSERYRVQVTNRQQFPLADVPVVLLDAGGRELFAARTDNTGHAELWANVVSSQQADRQRLMIACGTDTLREVKAFPELNRFTQAVPCHTPDNVDVFFIMDATGSMGDELRYMNAELQDVIRRSQSAVDGTLIRTGALVYRDHNDDYLNRLSPLTEDMSLTQTFLNEQYASGGGDYEEAVPEALMAAVNVAEWSPYARARIAFLVLDAPCHSDSVTIALLHRQAIQAAQNGIRIVPVVCSGLQESGELLMRELALLTNGTSFFLTDDSGIGDTHLKPTTDSLKVEHLNDMLVRTIIEFSRMPECSAQWADSALIPTDEEAFLPNPFGPEDVTDSVAHQPDKHVLSLDEVLTVRPNPCTDYCLADLPLGAEALYLVDLTGKTLADLGAVPADTRALTISTAYLPTGIYFLKAYLRGHWYTKKVIVR